MRTSASYYFDGQADLAEVSLDGSLVSIEFRGDEPHKLRQHYVRICGLNPTACHLLALKLLAAAKAIKDDRRNARRRKGGAKC